MKARERKYHKSKKVVSRYIMPLNKEMFRGMDFKMIQRDDTGVNRLVEWMNNNWQEMGIFEPVNELTINFIPSEEYIRRTIS